MSDGRSSVTFAAPAAGISSESAGHGSRHTIVVSTGPAAVSQHNDAGMDQTMEARASSRSRAPSDDGDGRTQVRKSRKGEKSSSPRGSPSDPRTADQQLDEELRKHQLKTEEKLSEAAEQHDEHRELGAECVSLKSTMQAYESDEAGCLQRMLGLERMKDEHDLATEQLSVRGARLNELQAMIFDANNENQQFRAEHSEILASLQQTTKAAEELRSQVNHGNGFRARLTHENEQLQERLKLEESLRRTNYVVRRCSTTARCPTRMDRFRR